VSEECYLIEEDESEEAEDIEVSPVTAHHLPWDLLASAQSIITVMK
jgi:hypothetical protein